MNNDIKAFTFYKNYYELIKHLPNKNRLIIYDAITKYMFENEEPILKGLNEGIWINIKMVLDNNKKNIENGKKGGRPKQEKEKPKNNPTNNPKETQKKPNPKPNNIYYLLFIISNNIYNNISINNNIYNKIYEWLEYKEQKKEKYTEIGLKNLLTQIDKKIDEYGEQAVIDLISDCMSNNYKGIIFDKLKKKGGNNSSSFLEIMKKEYDR